jgi:hypothetical protein
MTDAVLVIDFGPFLDGDLAGRQRVALQEALSMGGLLAPAQSVGSADVMFRPGLDLSEDFFTDKGAVVTRSAVTPRRFDRIGGNA